MGHFMMFMLKWEISWHKLRASCQTVVNKQPAKQRRDDEMAMLGTRHVAPSPILSQFHVLLPPLGAKSDSVLHLAQLGWRAHSQEYFPAQKRHSWKTDRPSHRKKKKRIRAVWNTCNSVDQMLFLSSADRELGRTTQLFECLLNNPAYFGHTRLPGCNSVHRTCLSSLCTRMRDISLPKL